MNNDTIAAIATAPGEASVSIVRISGPDALAVADCVFAGEGKPSVSSSHSVLYGHVRDASGTRVDEALFVNMFAPRTYTAEDVVEIQGHGGAIAAQRILRTVLEAGARLAEPGEFTKRAFLNGRIDLTQAEAVLDLIRARSDRASVAALEQLEGALSQRFNGIYEELLAEAAKLEATLDFPEDELPENVLEGIIDEIRVTAEKLAALVASWDEGHLLRDGALVVISGKPNAGKSTLLNALLGKDRAITSNVPGTTRDSIEEQVVLNGFPLRLVDTAGLRETDCSVEQEGIYRTHALVDKADLQLHLVDISQENDLAEALDGEENNLCKILVINKLDLLSEDKKPLNITAEHVLCSLKTGEGLGSIKQKIIEKLSEGKTIGHEPQAVISERHRELALQAEAELKTALDLLVSGEPEHLVLVASQLKLCLEFLGQVTGREYEEALLDNIFSQFCIGK